ncbi:MAG: MHYT domain-containing protein [Bdellovibrionota bacterium]
MEMAIRFNPTLVTLSIIVAIFASYVALNLANSVTEAKGKARAAWLCCGALAMGIGIWSMHFIGMLAFEMPGMEMAYDVPLMILSVVIAVGASGLALYVVSRLIVPMASLISAGIAMAVAIAGMHYTGMYSMRMEASIQWNIFLVVVSIVIALVASFSALFISIRLRNKPEHHWKLMGAATLMGVAIAGMHYVGMIAATFVHDHDVAIHSENLLVTSGLTATVLVTTLLILGLALAGSIGQRIWTQRRKTNEEIVRKSEEKFRALVEAVKDYAVFMLDTTGHITNWNFGAERVTGYKANEVVNQPVSLFYTDEDIYANTAEKELQAALETGHFETEALRKRKDGSIFWADVVIAPLYDQDGNLSGYSKVTRDITELKEADLKLRKINEDLEKRVQHRTNELQAREAQLRSITNAVPILIGQLDREERFLLANDALSKWFERTNEQMIGATFKEVLGEDRYPANEPHIRKALSGQVVTYERLSHSADRSAVLNITFVPEFDESNQVTGFILVASDITKHKEIEKELKKAIDAAEVASETKSAFLANMSHEIRTPLGAVLGFSELIMNQDISASERANSFEIIRRNGSLLSNIINDILDLSKVEAGKMEVEKIDVPFVEVLTELGSLLSLEASEKGIKLTVVTEGMIPKIVKTDPLRLRQILLNIVGNALKFTDRGSVEVKVRLVADLDSSLKLAFIIKDTGKGIQPEQAEKLFTPFTQADVSTTRKFGGTGLGLVLSKKLANALGGDVILKESNPGEGSTFVITIDPGESESILFQNVEESHKVLKLPLVDRQFNLHDLKVLVVEDSLDNQDLIKHLLRGAGAVVETANNGKEGFTKGITGDYEVILMDLQMPEMDGYEATRTLRQSGYTKPIIALTAHAMKEERRRCLESGFDDHLTKPIDRKILLQVLSEYSLDGVV